MSDKFRDLGEKSPILNRIGWAITMGLAEQLGTIHEVEELGTGKQYEVNVLPGEKIGDILKEGGGRLRPAKSWWE